MTRPMPPRLVALADRQLAAIATFLDDGILQARNAVAKHGDLGAISCLRAAFEATAAVTPLPIAGSLAAAMVRLAKHTGYSAVLDLPVEYVRAGWLCQWGDEWHPVVKTSDRWHDCDLDDGNCVALGFTGDLAGVLDELLEPDAPDADLSEPGESWLHFHAGDQVQVRIPCEATP